jgi:hypothetical protein
MTSSFLAPENTPADCSEANTIPASTKYRYKAAGRPVYWLARRTLGHQYTLHWHRPLRQLRRRYSSLRANFCNSTGYTESLCSGAEEQDHRTSRSEGRSNVSRRFFLEWVEGEAVRYDVVEMFCRLDNCSCRACKTFPLHYSPTTASILQIRW